MLQRHSSIRNMSVLATSACLLSISLDISQWGRSSTTRYSVSSANRTNFKLKSKICIEKRKHKFFSNSFDVKEMYFGYRLWLLRHTLRMRMHKMAKKKKPIALIDSLSGQQEMDDFIVIFRSLNHLHLSRLQQNQIRKKKKQHKFKLN